MKTFFFLTTFLSLATAIASEAPKTFTYQGKIFKSNGLDPVEASAVTFKVQIRSPDGLCLLFEETYLRDMTGTGGIFTLIVGEGSNTGASALNLSEVFDNSATKIGASGCTYVPISADTRRVRFSYTDGLESIVLPTDQSIRSVPYAFNATTIQGLGKNKIIQVSNQTTQAKVDALAAASADILALANGTSTNYADRSYADSKVGGKALDLTGLTNGQSLVWNGTQNKWETSTPSTGTVTSVIAGAGLSGGSITSSGTISLPSTGTTGTYTKVTTDSFGRVTAGAGLAESDLPSISSAGKISGSAMTSGTIAGTTSLNTSGAITTTGTMTATNLSATLVSTQVVRFFDSTNSHKIVMSVPGAIPADYNFVLPINAGTAGQILSTDGNGNTNWISSVLAGDSRLSDSRTPSGNAAGDLSGTYPNPSVAKIQGISVSNATPSVGQVHRYNGTTLTPAYLNVFDLKTAAGLSQIPSGCTTSQTMTYSSVIDTFTCNNITIASSAVSGLGTVVSKDVPASGDASSTEVVLGTDSRLTNSRAPSGSAGGDLIGTFPSPTLTTTGVAAGTFTKVTVDLKGRVTSGDTLIASDIPAIAWSKITSGTPTTVLGYGITDAVKNAGGVSNLQAGLEAAKPSASSAGKIYFATDANKIYYDTGSAWSLIASSAGAGGTLTALTGDVTASGAGSVSSVVAFVGGSSAAAVHTAELLATAATNANTASTLVKRDASGNFAASSVMLSEIALKDSGNNTIKLQAPATVATSYSLKLPAATGTSGQFMTTNGSGDLSWAGLSGDATMTSSGAVTVNKVRGVSFSSTTPTTGNVLKFDGTSWAPYALGLSDLKSSVSGSLFSAPNCTAIQSLSWSSLTDAFSCINLQEASGSQRGLVQVGTGLSISSGVVSLPSTGVAAGTYRSMTVDLQGRVTAASNPTTVAEYGLTDAIKNNGGVSSIKSGTEALRPAAGISGSLFIAADTGKIWRDNGTVWELVASALGSGGTVTSVTTGAGLTGGTITGTGAIAVDAGTTANKIVQLDSSARLPAVDGSQLTNLQLPPFSNMVVQDASLSWTPPAGVTKVYVQIWGGGGGGAGGQTGLGGIGGSGGGGGSYAAGIFTLSGTGAVTVSIGAGGSKGTAGNVGSAGTATSFGSYISAGGGSGGAVGTASPTTGGASTAVLNIAGALGLPALGNYGGSGGSSGNGGGQGGPGSYATGNMASAGSIPGGGGGGGFGALATVSTGGNGASGRVIIWW
jgi:hypothetical protein